MSCCPALRAKFSAKEALGSKTLFISATPDCSVLNLLTPRPKRLSTISSSSSSSSSGSGSTVGFGVGVTFIVGLTFIVGFTVTV